jgi:hypothetical protein
MAFAESQGDMVPVELPNGAIVLQGYCRSVNFVIFR